MWQVNSVFWFWWLHVGGGSLASHSSQQVERHSSVLSCHQRSHCGCFSRPCAQGSVISAFNPLAAQGYVLQSVRQWCRATWVYTVKVYQQCWKEWAGWCVWCTKNAISVPKLADFLVNLYRVGETGHKICIYCSAIHLFRTSLPSFLKMFWSFRCWAFVVIVGELDTSFFSC